MASRSFLWTSHCLSVELPTNHGESKAISSHSKLRLKKKNLLENINKVISRFHLTELCSTGHFTKLYKTTDIEFSIK